MMLFPQPREMEILDGVYAVKEGYQGLDLMAFYQKIKAGNQDVQILSAPLLAKEEYIPTFIDLIEKHLR